MERFKLNEKEYFIEVKNNFECTITEFGNANNQFVMDINEMRELRIGYKKAFAFSEKGIVNDFITEINVAALTEDSVIFDVKRKNTPTSPPIKVPLRNFCKEVLEVYMGEGTKEVSDNMQCLSVALKAWKSKTNILFMDKNCGIVDSSGDIVGVGYFDDDKLIAISNCNLSMFTKLNICLPKQSVEVELMCDEQINKKSARYNIMQLGFSSFMLTPTERDAIATFDLKNQELHDKICNFFKFKEIGKAKSNLDNFFDI